MAQFKRALFTTSYFGKAYAFTGTYRSRVVDAGEPFSGQVDLKLKALLPTVSYPATSDSWVLPNNWATLPDSSAHTSLSGASATFFACADKIILRFLKSAGGGQINVLVKDDDGNEIKSHTLDTSLNGELHLSLPYANHWVTVQKTDSKPVTLLGADARVATLSVDILADTEFSGGGPASLKNEYPVIFPNGLEPDSEGYLIARTSQLVSDQRFVSAVLHLATSDTDPAASPVIDELVFSSGDIHDYAEDGFWYAAINLHNVAADSNKTFRRAKRLSFRADVPAGEQANWWDQYLAVRSTSKPLAAGATSIPSDADVRNPAYWKAETATYRLYGGQPVPRISLGQAQNGGFAESQQVGSGLYGPFSAGAFQYAHTVITKWARLQLAAAFPSQSEGTNLLVQLWDTKEVDRYLPVYEYDLRGGDPVQELPLSLPEAYPELYLRLVLRSTPNRQTPVIDQLALSSELHFSRSLAFSKHKLSGLDNAGPQPALPKQGEGVKLLETVDTTRFGVPAAAGSRTYRLEYTPRYPNQALLYYGTANGDAAGNQTLLQDVPELRIFSRVTPEEPVASTRQVDPKRLTWHYQYDGGSVLFPQTVNREVGTDFTPDLTNGKAYRFMLHPGWHDEHFRLPQNLSWEEAADILSLDAETLQEANPNAITYGGKLPAGSQLLLPNQTNNPLVSLIFQSTTSLLSERSLWNGHAANEWVQAQVTGNTFEAVDWTSEERFFVGVLNPGNLEKSYLRTQRLGQAGEDSARTVTHTGKEPVSYLALAQTHGLPVADLLLANNALKELAHPETAFVQPGDSYLLPVRPSLPAIPPEVWFDGENPYRVEVIPGTTRRTNDGLLLADDLLVPGSDDEPAIRYTLRPSLSKTQTLTRGSFAHGREALPYANVMSVSRIVNDKTGTVYTPYTKSGNSEMGDYILSGNSIDWSPSHPDSREPLAGESYTVTFVHGMVDALQILYTSSYTERAAFDKLWRSREVKELHTVVGPNEEKLLTLPDPASYSDYRPDLANVSYVVEDDDLWVQSAVVKTEDGEKLLLTMNGKDPKRNWHPTIETGFYYLNDQEHYLYSEPLERRFAEDDIPVLANISYDANGLQLKQA